MGIMRFNYRSQELGRYVDVTVTYPTDNYSYIEENLRHPTDKKKRVYKPGMKFQTVYLMHGGGDDDTLTYRYTNAELYAQRNNVMLVTPNISNSFGVDTAYGVKYAAFLGDELPAVIQSLFASSPKREDNFIVGYAMGGNVALGMAITRPELYDTCVDISGGIGVTLDMQTLKDELDGEHFRNNFPLYNASFGSSADIEGSRFDLYSIAKNQKESGAQLCKFYIVCGNREFIRERVEADVRKLQELHYNVEYTLADGYDHDFKLWDEYIKVALDDLLPLKREAIMP